MNFYNYRTKVECAGSCLSFYECFAFEWLETNEGKKCNLIQEQDVCIDSNMGLRTIYVGTNDKIKKCIGMKLSLIEKI